MLTRLQVSGFKNLVDVDVRFGPFTCIAGANGVGKSNLFDAITFLSALADKPLLEAALTVRDQHGRAADVRSLFHRVGTEYAPEISFIAEMIIPSDGLDDLGQEAHASITFLRYSLKLAYREDESLRSVGSLEITHEELVNITLGEAPKHLLFPHSASWRKSVVHGRRSTPFISTSTEEHNDTRVITLHGDGGTISRPLNRLAANLPRTALSISNAAENPTALLARREMQSWQLLHLEPSSLRRPDDFSAPAKLATDGSHLAATLYSLARSEADPERVYLQVANRLSGLLADVNKVWVDRDDKRGLLTLQVTDFGGTSYPAQVLSDGTLRFLAIVVLERATNTPGLLCLEEPENGIHPERIPVMLTLLQDIVVDVSERVGSDNPLRQVIINTHSPAVVAQVPDGSLLIAESRNAILNERRFKSAVFSGLPGTWRVNEPHAAPVARGKLMVYLNPLGGVRFDNDGRNGDHGAGLNGSQTEDSQRVMDREDLQLMLPFEPVLD